MRHLLIGLLVTVSLPWLPCAAQTSVAPAQTASAAEAPVNRPVRDKWALVVGVGTFASGKVPKLKYAAKDARDFRNFLVNEANFAPDHVRLLLDGDATQRRVVSELGNKFLARVAKPDDVVVLFFSSHGSPSQLDIKGKNFLVAYDSDPDDLFATGINMDGILETARDRIDSQRILLVLDACHSGSIGSNEKSLSRPANFDAEQFAQGSGKLVICSSNPEESSWESKRYHNGIFTRKLLEGLRMNGKQTTLGEAFPFVQKSVAAEAQEDYAARQTPALRSKWSGNELVLAIPSAAPQAVPVSVRQELVPDSTVPRVSKPVVPVKPTAALVGDYGKGLKNYHSGNFGTAVQNLTAAVNQPGVDKANACFYLGSAYSKLGKTSQAVRWWREAARIDPDSPAGMQSINLASYYAGAGGSAKPAYRAGAVSMGASAASPSAVRASVAVSVSGGASKSPVAAGIDADVDPAQLKDIMSKLPAIPRVQAENQPVSEFLGMSISQLAGMVGEAAARRDRAEQATDRARRTMTTAKSLVYSLVPADRKYGESEQQFKQRRQIATQRVKELLCPYEQEVSCREAAYAQESDLYNRCQAANSGGYGGYGSTGYGTTNCGTTTSTYKK